MSFVNKSRNRYTKSRNRYTKSRNRYTKSRNRYTKSRNKPFFTPYLRSKNCPKTLLKLY